MGTPNRAGDNTKRFGPLAVGPKVARPSDPIGLRRVGVSLPDRAGGDCRAIRLIGSYHQRSRKENPTAGRAPRAAGSIWPRP